MSELDEPELLGMVAHRMAGRINARLAAASVGPAGPRQRTPVTVARTMVEASVLCPGCTHPFGRHEFVAGCVAGGDESDRCGCLGRPAP